LTTYTVQHGCNIGYTGPQFAHIAANLPSAFQQPSVIDTALEKECPGGHILRPFQTPSLCNLCTSDLGLVPKHVGGWRVIYYFSAPAGNSINDCIDPLTYSLSYCIIDHACTIINKLGSGTLLCILKYAFHLIPVRPADWNLLGICWKQQFFIDHLVYGQHPSSLTVFHQHYTGYCSITMEWNITALP